MLAGQVLWQGAGLRYQAQPFGAGLAPHVLLPLRAVVAQRADQRPRRRQALRREVEREFVERGQMPRITTAERDLGGQPRAAREQAAHRGRLALGEFPVPVQRASRLLDHAHAAGHDHQARRRRHDAGRGQRQRLAREIRLRQRQEAAEAVVERQHRVNACGLDAAAPAFDQLAQLAVALELDQTALAQAAAQRHQRGIEPRRAVREEQRDAAPGLGRVHQPRRIERRRLGPAAGLAVAQHLDAALCHRDVGERADRVGGVQERRLVADQLGRQAQLDGQAVAQAQRDQDAFGDQPRRALEHRARAERAGVEGGRVDDQHRRPLAAQEAAPGQVQRLAGRAPFGQPRALHMLQPLHRRHRLGALQARQRGTQAGGGRDGAGQRRRIGIEPVRQGRALCWGPWPGPYLPRGASASRCCA